VGRRSKKVCIYWWTRQDILGQRSKRVIST